MKSKSHSKSSPAGTKNRGPDILARMLNQVCPDFYVISERHPLPPAAQSTSNPTSATSSLATSTDMGYTSTSKSDDKNVPQPHPQHSPKQTDSNNIKPPSKNESPRKQHTSSSDESHSFSSSTIPPKSSSSFSTEDEKNGNSGKSRHSHDHSNQATTISGSSATKSSEAQLTHNNIQAQNQAQQPCAPQVMIEGRMINFDGSGITIPSAGILFGGYSMNQYLAQNQHILSRSIFFHPAISSGANAGVMPQRFNPAVAYPFDLTSVPALQGGAVAGGGIATNQQPQPPSSNNNGEKKSSSELNSSSDNSF